MTLKSKLKEFSWLYALNARYKSALTKRIYSASVARYAGMPPPIPCQDILRVRLTIEVCRVEICRPLRIFFLGTDEHQDRSGTLQALGEISELNYFTRADGCYGQNDPASPLHRKRANTKQLWALLKEQSDGGKPPDILIAQTWASFIEPEIFSRIRKAYGTFIINISMDDRHQYWGEKIKGEWSGTFPLIPHIDLALTAAPEAVDWYLKEGCPAFFFPEASDPFIFHPMPELPKIHDVCFVGARYGIREQIVLALRSLGVSVSTFGQGWEGGRLPIEEVPRLFAQSKIILGIGTIGHCTDFFALKLRDFDGPMSGSFYLTHDNPDLRKVYEIGREIETYRDIADCVEKVKWYLLHDDERELIAARGRQRAISDHTWHRRFSDLLAHIPISRT